MLTTIVGLPQSARTLQTATGGSAAASDVVIEACLTWRLDKAYFNDIP